MATQLAVETLNANGAEGTLILPLVEMVVADCSQRPLRQRKAVRQALQRMVDDFPKTRGSRPARGWSELQTMLEPLEK